MWQTDAYQSTGCYNLLCSGFVQTSNSIAIGATITPVSTLSGSQYDISILIWKVSGVRTSDSITQCSGLAFLVKTNSTTLRYTKCSYTACQPRKTSSKFFCTDHLEKNVGTHSRCKGKLYAVHNLFSLAKVIVVIKSLLYQSIAFLLQRSHATSAEKAANRNGNPVLSQLDCKLEL